VRVDLHVHSTASDGAVAPADVARRAAAVGLGAFALTDHDTVAGVAEARAAGAELGVRVIGGCEFSVAGPGGELHLLAYFLPERDSTLEAFLVDQRQKRLRRAEQLVARLQRLGVAITIEQVQAAAGAGAVGRPHVARAMVAAGAARDVQDGFDKYLGFGRPAFVPKVLPPVGDVTALVRGVGGVTSAAHLNDRGVRSVLQQLKQAGVDGVEVRHPSHDAAVARRLEKLAVELDLAPSGGTDWHGDVAVDRPVMTLGSLDIPSAWLDRLERMHAGRAGAEVTR
jgi:predicted metal-dependent phosphoesterase TrpH